MNRQELDVEPGVKRAVARILIQREGVENAVKKDEIIELVKRYGYHRVEERKVRLAINELRKEGVMICSGDQGYWMAENWEELEKFISREIDSRIEDLSKTKKVLRLEGKKRWGEYSPERQESFI